MLYGYLGFRPTIDGFAVAPRLPRDWPELSVTRIHLHDHVLDVTATRDGGLRIAGSGPADEVVTVHAPAGVRLDSTEGVTVRLEIE
jgi:cellobiose phosphorylase